MRKNPILIALGTLAVLALTLYGGYSVLAPRGSSASADSGERLSFNYGMPTSDYFTVYMAQEMGLYEEAGLAPEFHFFQSGAPLLAALKSNSLDVVTSGNGILYAMGQGVPLKIVTYGNNAASATWLVARKGSGIDSVDDITTRTRLAAAPGTCSDTDIFLLAQKLGLDYDKLNLTNIAPPLYQSAFASSSIDAGIAWGPYAQQLAIEGHTLIAPTPQILDGEVGACPNLTAVRAPVLEDHPDLALKLIEVQDKAEAAVRKDPQRAAEIMAKRLGVPTEVALQNIEESLKLFPTVEAQASEDSPFSLVSGDGAVATLKKVAKAMVTTGAFSQPLPDKVIEESVVGQFVQDYVKNGANK